MPECSLCGALMGPEGGAILFADGRGIPFEVCGKCERVFDVLRTSTSQPECEKALDYISHHADGIGNRGTYDLLMSYIEKEVPFSKLMPDDGAEHAHGNYTEGQAGETESEEEARAEEAYTGRKRKIRGLLWAVGVLLVGIIVVFFILKSFPNG
jgi:hypothetical protein